MSSTLDKRMSTLAQIPSRVPPKGCPFHQVMAQADRDPEMMDTVKDTILRHQDNPMEALTELHQKYGRAFQVETGQGTVRFDHHPDTARKLLVNTEGSDPDFKKSATQTHGLASALGQDNVLIASGADWHSSREALSEFFGAQNMKTDSKIQTMSRVLDKHLDKVESGLDSTGQAEIDLSKLFREAALDVALNTLFSVQPTDQELVTLTESYEVLNKNVGKEWLLPAEITGIKAPGQEYDQALSDIRDWAVNVVETRQRQTQKPNDALTALMGATDPDTGLPYDQERLVSEVQNLMLAGHETTANLLTWTLTEVARNPLQQAQMRNEIKEACDQNIPTANEMKALGSIFRCWREQATEHPPNFLIAREAVKDTSVGPKDAPVPIKAGTTVMVSTQHANLDTEGGMFSFGGGKRFCLGINMARQETELAVTRFLQRFDISDTGARGVHSGLTQTPEDTLVRVSRRSGPAMIS
jgi:cytochrome P450